MALARFDHTVSVCGDGNVTSGRSEIGFCQLIIRDTIWEQESRCSREPAMDHRPCATD